MQPITQNITPVIQIAEATWDSQDSEKIIVDALQLTKIVESNVKDVDELVSPKAFEVIYTSTIKPPENSFFIDFINESFLSVNEFKDFNYILHTKTGVNIGYPADMFNAKYYLLTDNLELNPGMYGTEQIQIELKESTEEALVDKLINPRYCQTDSDCSFRSNFCSQGAYNEYHLFYTPWGCGGPGEFQDLGDASGLCDFDKQPELKYDSVSCVSNQCQMVNPKTVCVEPTQ